MDVLKNLMESFGTAQLDSKYKCKVLGELPSNNRSEDLMVKPTIFHGLRGRPSVCAYDSMLAVLAIGTKLGAVHLFGQPGVETVLIIPDINIPVSQICFVPNEGLLVSVHHANSFFVWSFQSQVTRLLKSVPFPDEISVLYSPPDAHHWVYIGSKKGNVHVFNTETFQFSDYIIYWNHVVDVSDKKHPGRVVAVLEQPRDPGRILIVHSLGNCVLWDTHKKKMIRSYQSTADGSPVTCACWRSCGTRFLLGHDSGAVSVWGVKQDKPEMVKSGRKKDAGVMSQLPIEDAVWITHDDESNADPVIVYAGGNNSDEDTFYLHISGEKTDTSLEFPSRVRQVLGLSKHVLGGNHNPSAVLVLTDDELAVIDLTSDKFEFHALPYGLDLLQSPITCSQFYSFVNPRLMTALRWANRKQTEQSNKSNKPWPIEGGCLGEDPPFTASDLLVTGHQDGSVCFWDISTISLHLMLRIRGEVIFSLAGLTIKTTACTPPVLQLEMCCDSRTIVVAYGSGDSFVLVFNMSATSVFHRSIICDHAPDARFSESPVSPEPAPPQSTSPLSGSNSTTTSTTSIPSPSTEKKQSKGFFKKVFKTMRPPSAAPQQAMSQDPASPTRHIDPFAELDDATKKTLQMLISLGFTEDWALVALSKTQNSNEAAAWLMEHAPLKTEEQKKIDATVNAASRPVPTAAKAAATRQASAVSTSVVDPLVEDSIPLTLRQHNMPAGFQVRVHYRSQAFSPVIPTSGKQLFPCTALCLNSHYGIVAIGDAGGVSFIDLRARALIGCYSSQIGNSSLGPVTAVTFGEVFEKENSLYPSPCVLVGTNDGSVHFVFFSTAEPQHRGDPFFTSRIAPPVASQKNVDLKGIFLLDRSGNPLPNPTKVWEEDETNEEAGHDGSELSAPMSQADLFGVEDDVTKLEPKQRIQFLVAVSTDGLRQWILPDKERLTKAAYPPESVVVKAALITIQEESLIVTLTSDHHCRAHTILNLTPLMDWPLEEYPNFEGKLDTSAISFDGRLIVVTPQNQIQRASLAVKENMLNLPFSLGNVFVPMQIAPQSKSGLSGAWKNLLTAVVTTHDHDREQLFGGSDRAKAKEQRAHMEPGAATAAINRAKQAALERGEKLSKMEDKSSQMRDNAGDFVARIREYNERQANKKWWEL